MSRVIAAYDLDEDHGRLWVNADLKRIPDVVIVANQPMDRAQTVTYVPEAKLREELAKWERLAAGIDLPEYPVTQFKPKDLECENAKLRELVDILCFCMQIHKRCDDCRLNGAKGELGHDPLLACDGLNEMLKELGIEVD